MSIMCLLHCCRKQFTLNEKVKSITQILENICTENGLGFINNKNIFRDDLYEDGLHLNDNGKTKLAGNFIYALNRLIFYETKHFNMNFLIIISHIAKNFIKRMSLQANQTALMFGKMKWI